MSETTPQPETADLRAALDAARAVRTREDLSAALDRVAAAIAATLRCRTAVINLHRPAWDDFEVAGVHGSEQARRTLLGQASTWEQWAPYLVPHFERHGAHYVPSGGVAPSATARGPRRPDAPLGRLGALASRRPLLAVMRRANGDVLGVISVDEPIDGLRPPDEDSTGSPRWRRSPPGRRALPGPRARRRAPRRARAAAGDLRHADQRRAPACSTTSAPASATRSASSASPSLLAEDGGLLRPAAPPAGRCTTPSSRSWR